MGTRVSFNSSLGCLACRASSLWLAGGRVSPLAVGASLNSGVVFDRGGASGRAEPVDRIGRVAQLRRLRRSGWVGGRVRVLLGA